MKRKLVAGFTLIEILIVITIIAILAGLILTGISYAMTQAKISTTEGTIRAMGGALETYRQAFGDYPPSSVESFRARVPNDVNNGIETLVGALSTQKKGGPYWRAPREDMYRNVDKDQLEGQKKIFDWFFGDDQFREVMDSFSQTLFYMHHSDFANPKPIVTKYKLGTGDATINVKPYMSEQTKTYANAGRYQLASAGPDGQFGTSDDIRGW